jgi:hypothetical protein
MRSIQILGIVGFAAAMTGCVPDWARENETGFLMEIANIKGLPGNPGIEDGETLYSDVDPVFPDQAQLTVQLFRTNPAVATSTPLEDVRLESYNVRYFRTDGHSVEGIDVPHRITGPLNSVMLHAPAQVAESTADIIIDIVRHQAKLEPPLINLVSNTVLNQGQGLFTAVAEITIFARQVTTGEPIQATGRIQVTFADFANAQ